MNKGEKASDFSGPSALSGDVFEPCFWWGNLDNSWHFVADKNLVTQLPPQSKVVSFSVRSEKGQDDTYHCLIYSSSWVTHEDTFGGLFVGSADR